MVRCQQDPKIFYIFLDAHQAAHEAIGPTSSLVVDDF
jgi:hypothetical protein